MSDNQRVARYRLRVHKIVELEVEVEAGSIDEARFFVESQQSELQTTLDRLGVKHVQTDAKVPTRFRVVGKHQYIKNGRVVNT